MKHLFLPLVIAASGMALVTSCGSAPEQAAETVTMMSVDELEVPATIVVSIDGMACPNGCAKPIERGCAKLGGMALSQVSFAEGKGYFTYDAAKLTEAEIIACIEGTNGGGHYKVTGVEAKAPNADDEQDDTFNSGESAEEVKEANV